MKMKSNRLVGATRQRNTASIRRTVLYTAVVAAIGLFLAGLPVAGTTPTAQAQTAQHQIDWYINDAPRLYYKGTHVGRESLNNGWNDNVSWGRVENGGFGRSNTEYTYAIGGDSNSYYTYGIWDSPVENQVEWRMGSRIGTQQISVYIPNNSRATMVTYQIQIEHDQQSSTVASATVNQRDYRQRKENWATLRNPGTGTNEWVVNGDEVSVWVNDNEAMPHWDDARYDSRIGINAVAMRCLDNCTTTAPPAPPTTARTTQTSDPRISGLGGSMGIVNSSEGGGPASDGFQVSPPSATATADESYRYLRAWIEGSGSSRTLRVTTDRRADPGSYTVTVTVTDGSTSVTKNVSVTVVDKKFRIADERGGLFNLQVNKRIIALRNFRTIEGEWVRRGDKGGIVAGEENLSHFGRSWIAEGAKVWDREVRVLGNALVEDSADLHDKVKVFGNAKVSGNVKLWDEAEVSGNARVSSWWHLTQVFGEAKVFGSASVHSRAKVSGKAQVSGNAQVFGNTAWAEVYGNAKVYDKAQVRNGAKVSVWARVCDEAQVRNNGTMVSGDAQVSGRTILTSGDDHGNGARYGDGCPDPTPTPPQPPQN